MDINKCWHCKFFDALSELPVWCFLCNEDEEDCMDYEETNGGERHG